MKTLIPLMITLFLISCENSRVVETETNEEGTVIKITYTDSGEVETNSKSSSSSATKNLPSCQRRGLSCGFSYSSSYKDAYKPYGQALKCKIEYWRPGENSGQAASYSRIFYTNCGSCLDAANKAKSDEFTSSESPTSYLIYQADGESLTCNTRELKVNTEYTTGWSFKVSTLEGSTCHEETYYSYASRATSGQDTCEE